jgi:16S rRNA A1518/A1519 N6-dimethyltransferase RsmA/KsgA/DIM1 with predicted DNA glycosylase/AP lyase activity
LTAGAVDRKIRDAVTETLSHQQSCDILKVGAGHGSFIETVLTAGGSPTITEMSKASFAFLNEKSREIPQGIVTCLLSGA